MSFQSKFWYCRCIQQPRFPIWYGYFSIWCTFTIWPWFLTLDLKHVACCTPHWDNFHLVWTRSTYPFWVVIFLLLIPHITLWTWPLKVYICNVSAVARSNSKSLSHFHNSIAPGTHSDQHIKLKITITFSQFRCPWDPYWPAYQTQNHYHIFTIPLPLGPILTSISNLNAIGKCKAELMIPPILWPGFVEGSL